MEITHLKALVPHSLSAKALLHRRPGLGLPPKDGVAFVDSAAPQNRAPGGGGFRGQGWCGIRRELLRRRRVSACHFEKSDVTGSELLPSLAWGHPTTVAAVI